MLGIAVSRMNREEYSEISKNVNAIGYAVFIPIFFAGIGLHFTFSFVELPLWIIGGMLTIIIGIKFVRTGTNEGEIINTWGTQSLPLALWFNYGTRDHGSLGNWPLHWKDKTTGKGWSSNGARLDRKRKGDHIIVKIPVTNWTIRTWVR